MRLDEETYKIHLQKFKDALYSSYYMNPLQSVHIICLFLCSTSILGLNGDDAFSLRSEALCSLGLNSEFVGEVLSQVRHGQRSGTVVVNLEGALIP